MTKQLNNTGGLWINKFKRKQGAPDLQGTITINGESHKIVGWYTDCQGGKPKVSLRVNSDATQAQNVAAKIASVMTEPPKDFDDDIPF